MEAVADKPGTYEMIIINGGWNPQRLYFAHRKGWPATNETIEQNGYVDSMAN